MRRNIPLTYVVVVVVVVGSQSADMKGAGGYRWLGEWPAATLVVVEEGRRGADYSFRLISRHTAAQSPSNSVS